MLDEYTSIILSKEVKKYENISCTTANKGPMITMVAISTSSPFFLSIYEIQFFLELKINFNNNKK